MAVQFSPVMGAQARIPCRTYSVQHVDLRSLGEPASPISTLEHLRISAPLLKAHRLAGYSAATYVLQDSAGNLRSRDSMGNDIEMRPGGLVWTQGGSGVLHEVLPAAIGRELHAIRLLIRMSAQHRHAIPAQLRLEPERVPQWQGRAGDHARVIVGSFRGHTSPTNPADPFTLLDVRLRSAVHFELPRAHNALVYVLAGIAIVVADDHSRKLEATQAIAVHNLAGRELLQIVGSAHLLIMSGPALCEAVLKSASSQPEQGSGPDFGPVTTLAARVPAPDFSALADCWLPQFSR